MRTPLIQAAKRRAARRHDRSGRDDAGAALVLVLVFLTVGALIVGALTSEVSNDTSNTLRFASARALQYDASSATELAIQGIRYTPLLATTLNASPPAACWGTGAVSQLAAVGSDGVADSNGNSIDVWCSTQWTPTSLATRVVTISACLATVTAVGCALDPYLQAVVTLDDYPSGVNPPRVAGACYAYCGTALTVNSWTRAPAVPAVTGIGPASGPAGGGTAVTVNGTGFGGGTGASFVKESGGIPDVSNVVTPAASVTVNSSTSLTVTSPALPAGTYFVVATTPTGTSAYASGAVFASS